jgi:hypothetical protein
MHPYLVEQDQARIASILNAWKIFDGRKTNF